MRQYPIPREPLQRGLKYTGVGKLEIFEFRLKSLIYFGNGTG